MSTLKRTPAVPGLTCVHQGKVRDTFAIPDDPEHLLVVATDHVSTHNVTHESTIPKKGHVLTALTVFWMADHLRSTPNHLAAYGEDIFRYIPELNEPRDLALRAIVVRKLKMVPIEFIFRSRMAGSLWKDYYGKGKPNPYGFELPPGLALMSPFTKDIFTPTDKSETDDPMDANYVLNHYWDAALLARDAYQKGRAHAMTRGIELIDGKFEVGYAAAGKAILADECLTPDSCRFVKADEVTVGKEPTWLDKQYLREKAERIWAGGTKVPLSFDDETIAQTTARYEEIFKALTGETLSAYQEKVLFRR